MTRAAKSMKKDVKTLTFLEVSTGEGFLTQDSVL